METFKSFKNPQQESLKYPKHSPVIFRFVVINVFLLQYATCEEELNWHMCDVHELPDDLNFDTDFYCDVCSKWCKSESDLLIHKEEHNKKTDKACSFFLRGICIYGDEKC